jgi:hypothetical protein
MTTQEYDSNFVAQMQRASKRLPNTQSPPPPDTNTPPATDPTFDLRRKQANLAEAVMLRVFEIEEQAAQLTEIAKKLRAAVLANT